MAAKERTNEDIDEEDELLSKLLGKHHDHEAMAGQENNVFKQKTVSFRDSDLVSRIDLQDQYKLTAETKKKRDGEWKEHESNEKIVELLQDHKSIISSTYQRITKLEESIALLKSQTPVAIDIEERLCTKFCQLKIDLEQSIHDAIAQSLTNQLNKDTSQNILERSNDNSAQLDLLRDQIRRNEEAVRETQRERANLLVMAEQLSAFSEEVMKKAIETEDTLSAVKRKEYDISNEREELDRNLNTLSTLKMDIVRHRIELLKIRRVT